MNSSSYELWITSQTPFAITFALTRKLIRPLNGQTVLYLTGISAIVKSRRAAFTWRKLVGDWRIADRQSTSLSIPADEEGKGSRMPRYGTPRANTIHDALYEREHLTVVSGRANVRHRTDGRSSPDASGARGCLSEWLLA